MITYSWAVVLAGGDGRRLSAVARDARGQAAPKQYCSFGAPAPMVRWALARACRVVPRDRVLVVVNEAHRRFWAQELADIPPENLLIQPCNRGTATGVLFAVLEAQSRSAAEDPVLLLPSDHYVADEDALRWSLATALGVASARRRSTVLLGMEPAGVDPEYGWILPATADPVTGVHQFEEKPCLERACQLAACGALINAFIMVASAQALIELFDETFPALLQALRGGVSRQSVTANLPALYETLPCGDFSRDVLARTTRPLTVVRTPPCGWSDLGTPDRLQRFLARTRTSAAPTRSVARHPRPAPVEGRTDKMPAAVTF